MIFTESLKYVLIYNCNVINVVTEIMMLLVDQTLDVFFTVVFASAVSTFLYHLIRS